LRVGGADQKNIERQSLGIATADVTVSQQSMIYPAKTARRSFTHSSWIDESFDGHCRAFLLEVVSKQVLPKAAGLALSCQHALAPVYEFPSKNGKAIL
jgi:hypothetical protein